MLENEKLPTNPASLPASPATIAVPAAEVAAAEAPNPDPLDALGVNKAASQVWESLARHPEEMMQSQMRLATAWLEVATRAFGAAAGVAAKAPAVIEPAPHDARWKHPAWKENPAFDALKQSYLLATQAVLDGIDLAPDVDPETRSRVKFFTKQYCDALSPTNFGFLNPAVIEETVTSGGANLRKGMQNYLDDKRDNAGRPALVDKAAFQVGTNVAASKGEVVFRNELIELIQYTPTTESVYARPLLIVPPWINKFYILDLQPKNSLIKYATDNGLQTFVISWHNPDITQRDFGFSEYLELGPLAAVAAVREITGSEDVNQIGYCIGGTLSAMELAYLAKTDRKLVNSITFFATLTDFTEVGDLKNFLSPDAVKAIEKRMAPTGFFAARDMADTFSMLRANDLIWNVAVNRYLLGKDAPAFDLLYWNSDSTRMPAAMQTFYLTNMYMDNALVKGQLTHNGIPLELGNITTDAFTVASIEDHIAPWRSVYKMTGSLGGDVDFVLGHSGHIAGIINSPASGKGNYWENNHNPASSDEWFAGAKKNAGSWWPRWLEWISARSGERIPAPPSLGDKKHPPLAPAPGTYVLEMA